MRRNAYLGTVAAAITAVMVVAASTGAVAASGNGQGSGGGGGSGGGSGTSAGSDGTGDVFADLVVALRDVHGVPVLASFTVEGEEGPTVEHCVQPVSYAALPGLGATYTTVNPADGRVVYRIPLMGELIEAGVVADDEAEACDPQASYAMYVSEAELERLNMARQPADVQARKLDEVSIRLSTAESIGLDAAGRITTDGVAIDASPDHAAIYASLMSSGKIPGLASSPAHVKSFTTWMLAAASVGTAAGKEVPLTIDSIEYYNRIVGVPAEHVPSDTWTVAFRQTDPSNGESFVDYSGFSYTRDDVYQGCATWLDVSTVTWKVSALSEVVDFAALPPVARDTSGDGVADTVDDIAGFAQLADDVRAVIVYLHENDVIPGFTIDPVGTNTCAAQRAALSSGSGEDGLPPVAAITDGPIVVTNDTSAVFTFTADQDGASFACVLDCGAAAACTSPLTMDSLADGAHTLAVSAIDASDKEGPAALRSWTIDTVDPTVEIVTAPAQATGADTATFEFTTAGSTTVLCGLDGAALDTCSSPVSHGHLSTGVHSFVLAAVDAAGNSTSTAYRWSVLTSSGMYLRALYTDVLGRTAGDAEVGWWLASMDRGMSRSDAASGVAYSTERISTVVSGFYRDILKRAPDAAGLASWVGAAQNGVPLAQIAAAFYGSPEFTGTVGAGDDTAWVREVYRTMLSREPDAVGLAHWVALLAGGTPRAAVAYSVYLSSEATARLVDSLYRSMLHRPADAGGLAAWAPLTRTYGELALAVWLTTSEEFALNASR